MSPTLELDTLVLKAGGHKPPTDGDLEMCVMEAVAYVANEPWSDHPKCASEVIGAFLRRWNDDLDDEGRQMLKPFIPRLVGTAASAGVESRRAWMATDWFVRVHMPAWLELGGMKDQADAVRALPELIDADSWNGMKLVVQAARAAAGAAARAAAWAAARDAAWDAAGAAAGAAARDAAWAAAGAAAGAAARAAAWDAARDAAWDAAGAAARDALRPTAVELQKSALDLLERLIGLSDAA
jgi:hypothetical protein